MEMHHYTPVEYTSYFISHITYWNLILLVILFLITDLLRYKPVLVLSSVASIALLINSMFAHGIYFLMVG